MQKTGRGTMQRQGTSGRGGSGQSEGRGGGSRRRGTPAVVLFDRAKQAVGGSSGRSRGRRRTWRDGGERARPGEGRSLTDPVAGHQFLAAAWRTGAREASMAAVGDGNLREFSVSMRQREREGETRERDGEEREGGQERGRGSLAWRLGIEIISIWRSGHHGVVRARGRGSWLTTGARSPECARHNRRRGGARGRRARAQEGLGLAGS